VAVPQNDYRDSSESWNREEDSKKKIIGQGGEMNQALYAHMNKKKEY
jgi:hypothetical protein